MTPRLTPEVRENARYISVDKLVVLGKDRVESLPPGLFWIHIWSMMKESKFSNKKVRFSLL